MELELGVIIDCGHITHIHILNIPKKQKLSEFIAVLCKTKGWLNNKRLHILYCSSVSTTFFRLREETYNLSGLCIFETCKMRTKNTDVFPFWD